MKTRFLCLLSLVTVIVSYAPLAQAGEALQFDMPPKTTSSAVTESNVQVTTMLTPLPIEAIPQAIMPEVKPETTVTAPPENAEPIPVTVLPSPVEETPAIKPQQKPDVAVGKGTPPIVASPNPFDQPSKPATQATPVQPIPAPAPEAPLQVKPDSAEATKPVELGFTLSPSRPNQPSYKPQREMPHVPAAPLMDEDPQTGAMTDRLFTGNANSLVAKAVGSAEGTRTPEGDRTRAYYGHVDPGNRAWNRGSFSYQHAAKSPEDADLKQLNRLANQAKILEAKAADLGLRLTLEEKLNGIDLANQAPKAALDREGYVDWLAKARQRGMQGSQAVLWARTHAFINPVTKRWDAPGLGNTAESIGWDQARRMEAIARAIAANQHTVDQAIKFANEASKTGEMTRPEAIEPNVQEIQGIAHLLAEKLVDLFGGGGQIPEESKPLAEEPEGIQQLFGFAF